MLNLKFLSLINQTGRRTMFRVFMLVGMIQLSFMYSLTNGKSLMFLFMPVYILFLIISVELNEKILNKSTASLYLIYQSDRKKEILQYGCVCYCLCIQLIYTIIIGITMFVTGYLLKKDPNMVPLLLAVLFTGIYSTIFVVARYNSYQKLYYGMQSIFLLALLMIFILSTVYQNIYLPIWMTGLLTTWNLLVLVLFAIAFTFIVSYVLYSKNKGL